MEKWIEVARFDTMSEKVKKEKARIEDMALDVGLMPEKVVLLEENDEVVIKVHPEFYNYFQG